MFVLAVPASLWSVIQIWDWYKAPPGAATGGNVGGNGGSGEGNGDNGGGNGDNGEGPPPPPPPPKNKKGSRQGLRSGGMEQQYARRRGQAQVSYRYTQISYSDTTLTASFRFFKSLVAKSNGRGVERTLLQEECFRRTLRLYLEAAYEHDDPGATRVIQQAADEYPTVFSNLFNLAFVGNNSESNMLGYERAISLFLDIKLCSKCTTKILWQLNIALQLSKMSINHCFIQLLRQAYGKEYNMPNFSLPRIQFIY